MIPTIGVMVGFYIVARMIELLSISERHPVAKVFAVIALIVAAICIGDLVTSGTQVPPTP